MGFIEASGGLGKNVQDADAEREVEIEALPIVGEEMPPLYFTDDGWSESAKAGERWHQHSIGGEVCSLEVRRVKKIAGRTNFEIHIPCQDSVGMFWLEPIE